MLSLSSSNECFIHTLTHAMRTFPCSKPGLFCGSTSGGHDEGHRGSKRRWVGGGCDLSCHALQTVVIRCPYAHKSMHTFPSHDSCLPRDHRVQASLAASSLGFLIYPKSLSLHHASLSSSSFITDLSVEITLGLSASHQYASQHHNTRLLRCSSWSCCTCSTHRGGPRLLDST